MSQTKPKNKNNAVRNVKSQPQGTISSKGKTQTWQKKNIKKPVKNKNSELVTLLILGGVATLIIVVAMLIFNNSQQGKDVVANDNQPLLVRADSPTRGPENAPVTLVEFLDPECEACRASYPGVEQLLKEYEGRVRFVVRYYAGHSNSALAIAATEAAGEQGKYWEMQSLLFENQLKWGEQRTPQTELFIGYARALNLDINRFTASLQNPAYQAKANRDTEDARTLGVRGTPTFFVNGQMVSGVSKASVKALIDKALKV